MDDKKYTTFREIPKLTIDDVLKEVHDEMDDIRGSWNGDNAGLGEDMAHQASDIQETIATLRRELQELNEM